MKRDFLFGILFFGSIWGFSEAGLGGYLYTKDIPYASLPLTVIGFMILTIAKLYLPQKSSATWIASVAMLYKFLNTPFFACHLLAIIFLGISYDLVFGFLKIKSKAVLGFVATYLGYTLFALAITYVFRYRYWVTEGMPKVLSYIGTNGTFTAFANAFIVPLSFNVGKLIREGSVNPFTLESKLATGGISFITVLIWLVGAAKWF